MKIYSKSRIPPTHHSNHLISTSSIRNSNPKKSSKKGV